MAGIDRRPQPAFPTGSRTLKIQLGGFVLVMRLSHAIIAGAAQAEFSMPQIDPAWFIGCKPTNFRISRGILCVRNYTQMGYYLWAYERSRRVLPATIALLYNRLDKLSIT